MSNTLCKCLNLCKVCLEKTVAGKPVLSLLAQIYITKYATYKGLDFIFPLKLGKILSSGD